MSETDNDSKGFQAENPARTWVEGARLEVEDTCGCDAEGRPVFAWRVFSENGSLLGEGGDLRGPRVGEPTELEMLASLLAFLEHSAESEDGAILFPAPVVAWAREVGEDALSIARSDLAYEVLSGVLDADREGMLAILRSVRDDAGDVEPEPLYGREDSRSIDVRLQVYAESRTWHDAESVSWAIRRGLSDYDQDHRGHWGAAIVESTDTDEDLGNTLDSMLDEVYDSWAQSLEI